MYICTYTHTCMYVWIVSVSYMHKKKNKNNDNVSAVKFSNLSTREDPNELKFDNW